MAYQEACKDYFVGALVQKYPGSSRIFWMVFFFSCGEKKAL